MANRYIILYTINIDNDFWYIKENSTPENKEPNSVFLKNLINAPWMGNNESTNEFFSYFLV